MMSAVVFDEKIVFNCLAIEKDLKKNTNERHCKNIPSPDKPLRRGFRQFEIRLFQQLQRLNVAKCWTKSYHDLLLFVNKYN